MTLLLGHILLPPPRWKLHSTILPFQDQDTYLLYRAGGCEWPPVFNSPGVRSLNLHIHIYKYMTKEVKLDRNILI